MKKILVILLFFFITDSYAQLANGDKVQATQNLNVRSSYSSSASLITTVASGTKGTIIAGPQTADGYTWWAVSWDNGYAGWSVQDYLQKVVTKPDLIITSSVSASPNPVTAGNNVTISYTVKNNGDGNANSSQTRIQIKNSLGTLLVENYFTTSSLSVGSSTNESRSLSISSSAASGSYTVYVILDYNNSIGQSNTGNDIYNGSVTIQAAVSIPSAPTLNSPGSSPSPGTTISTLTPTMSWNAVSGATNYGLYVSDQTAGGNLVYNNDYVGNTTSLVLPAGALTAGHIYRWNMRASNSAGFSGYSSHLYFQTQAPDPTLTVFPSSVMQNSGNSFSFTGSNYTASGTVNRYIKYSGQSSFTQISSITANSSGQVSWTFAPSCIDPPVGTHSLYCVDASNGKQSSTVMETVTANPLCTPVINPKPVISNVLPSSIPPVNGNQLLTINGSNFQNGATLTFDPPTGANIESNSSKLTFVSSSQITYQINNGNDTGIWFVKVNNPDGQSSDDSSFIVKNVEKFLGFPLHFSSWTPYTALITSVFDHSMSARYCPDYQAIAFTGEIGNVKDLIEPKVPASCGDLYSYKKQDQSAFIITGLGNYVGTEQTGSSTLNYDGHPGYDYPVPIGTEVFAAADGQVVVVGDDASSGKYIRIMHSNNYYTQYLHLSEINVSQGNTVTKGQLIAKSGNTGGVAAHLHFEVKIGDVSVDPYGWTGSGSDPYILTTNVNLWEDQTQTYTITSSANENGTLTPSGNISVNNGADQSFTITPNTNYHIADVLVDGSSVGAVANYTFTNVNSNHTISASFAVNTYSLNIIAEHGTVVKVPDQASYSQGTNVQLTANPETGYHFANWSGDASGTTNSVSLAMNADKTVTANFAVNTYTITAIGGSNGAIVPSGDITVNYKADTTFTFIPENNYKVDSVLVDNIRVEALQSYTFHTITENHQISVWFGTVTSVDKFGNLIPEVFSLSQNYPNPFNPSTTIRYGVPFSSFVSIKIFNLLGQQVAELVNAERAVGWYEVTWNANKITTGIYLCKMDAINSSDPKQKFTQLRKILFLK